MSVLVVECPVRLTESNREQLRLLYADLRDHYAMSLTIEVDPTVDADRLRAALNAVVDRHASLRTRFTGREPVLRELREQLRAGTAASAAARKPGCAFFGFPFFAQAKKGNSPIKGETKLAQNHPTAHGEDRHANQLRAKSQRARAGHSPQHSLPSASWIPALLPTPSPPSPAASRRSTG